MLAVHSNAWGTLYLVVGTDGIGNVRERMGVGTLFSMLDHV
jgi:hypothetical protein